MVKNNKIMPTVVLTCICVVVALFLSVVNMFTGPKILEAQEEKANAALLEVLPDGGKFESIDVSNGYPEEVTAGYKASNGGFVFQMTVTGYKPGLIIMCGIDADGKITGAKFIQSNETLSAEVGLGDKFVGYDIDTITTDIIAGPTAKLTTNAYYKAIESALKAFAIANGGSVDLRSPEEILQSECNAAVGAEGLKFEKWFAYEDIGDADVYFASGSSSVVVFVDGVYVGISDGESVAGDGISAEAISRAVSVYEVYSAATLTEIEKPSGVNADVEKIFVSASGNYVFELRARGYGIVGDWHASGEHIKLKVAIDADGKIISTLTTYQNESAGVGDITADPEYYEQFNGKDVSDYSSVDNKTGATVSTSGYKKAIKYAFDAYEIVKGGK